ncbi:MAG: FtsW/RodA/SpoVE family cell cycle protein [Clostridiales bacterium]|nr:FtsW/RodA/SpoVE family cell cycle protein [Clostridiales bacterium]
MLPDTVYSYFLAISRWALAILAILFILQWVRCFLCLRRRTAVLATLVTEDGDRLPITSYEASIGRRGVSDIVLNLPNISRKHAVLTCTPEGWRVSDAGSQGGVMVKGKKINRPTPVQGGDKIALSGYTLYLDAPRQQDVELLGKRKKRKKGRRAASYGLLSALLGFFQAVMCLQLLLRFREDLPLFLPVAFGLLLLGQVLYTAVNRRMKGPPPLAEQLVFFLSTLGMAVCATLRSSRGAAGISSIMAKQMAAALVGFVLFLVLYKILQNVNLTMRLRYAAGIAALVLLGVNLIFGLAKYGAKNWIEIGPVSFQPSEFVKIAFIFAGAATLERLLTTHNLLFFLGFSGACIGVLGLIRDFGTASIFFVTMLIIIFIRSGDWKVIAGISALAAAGATAVVFIMPHVAKRFEAWRHVWQYASTSGYQQTRTMVAIGSGGLLGVGGGNGYLDGVNAASTDLVFGVVFEEWGGVVALAALSCFVLLALYAWRLAKTAQSAYYSIAICAAAGMFLFQTALNAFGATDILPLTGVTMPFVSVGGSSILSSWCIMAFFKAAAKKQAAPLN